MYKTYGQGTRTGMYVLTCLVHVAKALAFFACGNDVAESFVVSLISFLKGSGRPKE